MKKLVFMFSALAFIACQDNTKKEDASNEMHEGKQEEIIASAAISYASFGEKIDKEDVISASAMKEKFTSMKTGDTLDVKFKTQVEKVCKKKGCWMSVKLDDSLTSFVRFKDYSFFVPLNAEERETILEGKAFVTETSIDELRHYAKDAGKTEEEIAAITEPKTEYAFMATGVLMEEPTQD